MGTGPETRRSDIAGEHPEDAARPAPAQIRVQTDRIGTGGRFLLLLPISGSFIHVQYEWGRGKAAENLRKHGVDFTDAFAALEDENRLEDIDTRSDYGEERIHVIGMARGEVLFRDRHTPRGKHLQNHIGPKGHTT